MTIRIGCMADRENAYALVRNKGQLAVGAVIAGFATKPIPGAVCDDAVQRMVQFTAHRLQSQLDALLERSFGDPDAAWKRKEATTQTLITQLGKINDAVAFASRKLGQGIYLAGSICYVAGENYLCLPFGGGCAYRYDGSSFTLHKNQMLIYDESGYILDAIGGTDNLPITFDSGTLPVGAHLIMATNPLTEDQMHAALESLSATNAQFAAEAICNGAGKAALSNAIATIAQAAYL